MARPAGIPDHIPDSLVWDGDFHAYLNELDDPYLAGARFQDGPGIIWVTNASYGTPSWVFTRHALIEEGFANARVFSSKRGPITAAVLDPSWMLLPVEADAPEHAHFRDILRPYFTPKAMDERLEEVEGLCRSLIDAFIDRGRCEFIGEFAEILPNAIVVSMMGMPQEMLRQFCDWEAAALHGATNAIRIAANVAIMDYLKFHIAEQTRNPTSAMMNAIVTARIGDRPVTDAEILGLVYLLYAAGLDTVFSTLGWIMRHLATHPDLQTRLRDDPALIRPAVEEFGRAFGVSAPSRTVAEDVVFAGVTMKRGDQVILPTYLGSRDPTAWTDPHVIDIDRKPRHATFGSGAHVCLGIHLAKREMRAVIQAFLSRMRNIRLAEGDSFSCHAGSTIGVDRLVIEWDKP